MGCAASAPNAVAEWPADKDHPQPKDAAAVASTSSKAPEQAVKKATPAPVSPHSCYSPTGGGGSRVAELRKKFDQQKAAAQEEATTALSPSRIRAQEAAAVVHQPDRTAAPAPILVPSLAEDTVPETTAVAAPETSAAITAPQPVVTNASSGSTLSQNDDKNVPKEVAESTESPTAVSEIPNELIPTVSSDASSSIEKGDISEEVEAVPSTVSNAENSNEKIVGDDARSVVTEEATASPVVESAGTAETNDGNVASDDTPVSEKAEPSGTSKEQPSGDESMVQVSPDVVQDVVEHVDKTSEEEENTSTSENALEDAAEKTTLENKEASVDDQSAVVDDMMTTEHTYETVETERFIPLPAGLGGRIANRVADDDMMTTEHTFETVATEQVPSRPTPGGVRLEGMDAMMTTEHTVETFHDSFETVEETVVDVAEAAEEEQAQMSEPSESASSQHPSDVSDPSESTNSNQTLEDDTETSNKVEEGAVPLEAVAEASVSDDEDAEGAVPGPKKKKKRKKKRQKRKKKKKKKGKSPAFVADSTEPAGGMASEEELENDTLMELYTLLNVDPHSDATLDEEKVLSLLVSNPEYCAEKFKLEAFSESVYPLSVLCAIGATVLAISTCRDTFPDSIDACDSYVGTPLHYACSYKASLQVVQFLVEANPAMLTKSNRFGRSALHMACMFAADPEVIAFLLKKFPASMATQADTESMTPLHICCDSHSNNSALIQVFLDGVSGPATCLCPNGQGQVPLHTAVEAYASLECIELLVKACPASINVTDRQGQTAAALASSLKLDETIVDLLSTSDGTS